jgi:hypothetical protein
MRIAVYHPSPVTRIWLRRVWETENNRNTYRILFRCCLVP